MEQLVLYALQQSVCSSGHCFKLH